VPPASKAGRHPHVLLLVGDFRDDVVEGAISYNEDLLLFYSAEKEYGLC
jgi:hypothetical protein